MLRNLFKLLSLLSLARLISKGDARGLATRPLRRKGYRIVRKVK